MYTYISNKMNDRLCRVAWHLSEDQCIHMLVNKFDLSTYYNYVLQYYIQHGNWDELKENLSKCKVVNASNYITLEDRKKISYDIERSTIFETKKYVDIFYNNTWTLFKLFEVGFVIDNKDLYTKHHIYLYQKEMPDVDFFVYDANGMSDEDAYGLDPNDECLAETIAAIQKHEEAARQQRV